MKNKLKIAIVILLILLIVASIILIINKIHSNADVPDGYIAVFHGGSGEVSHETYIYKINNGNNNYGFKYINVTSNTEFYGSENWIHKITGKGKFDWTDGAFSVAEKNGAYSYVTLKNSNTTYTIEQFEKMFIMN